MNSDQDSLIARDLNILAQADNYLSLQIQTIKPFLGKRLLELGAGIGNHTRYFVKNNFNLIITNEFNKEFCTILKNTFGNKIEVFNIDLNNIEDKSDYLKSKNIDTIVAINVLEHIDKDAHCLKVLSDILATNGRIVLIVPASKILYSRIDKEYGHFRRYNKTDFIKYASMLNLDIEKVSYFNIIGWIGWFITAKVFKAVKIEGLGLKYFNRLLPYICKIESILPVIPCGLSLLVVLRKTHE